MFSVITNIYDKKTKGPTLMEIVHSHRKTEKVFFLPPLPPPTRDVWCVHHRWRDMHRFDIQVLATHASTWVHQYSSLLQWSVPLGQRGPVGGSFAYLHEMHVVHSNHRLNLCDIPTHKTTSPPERPFPHYIHSHRLAAEMWTAMKNNLLEKKKIWVVPSICMGFVNTFPTVFLQ